LSHHVNVATVALAAKHARIAWADQLSWP